MRKKYWLKYLLVIVIAAIMIIGVPIIINECYKSNSGYMTMWGAKDVLSYYGTVLGSFVTVLVLAGTINFTRKQIQRETFLKIEKEKWANLDRIISDILVELNPLPVFQTANKIGSTNPSDAINIFQEYMRKCKTSNDILLAYLSVEDLPKLRILTEKIAEDSSIYYNIAQESINSYTDFQAYINKETAKKALYFETLKPGTFAEEHIKFCKKVLDIAGEHTQDEFTARISACTGKIVDAYENTYRPLLQLRGQTFDKIYKDVQNEADEILHLWRKK